MSMYNSNTLRASLIVCALIPMVVLDTSGAIAQEAMVEASPGVTIAPVATTKPKLVASAELASIAERVCSAGYVLSEAAATACTAKTWPKPVKDQTRFANVGIGAEFNTLIRQLKN